MKTRLGFIFVLLIGIQALALDFKVIGPCSETPLLQTLAVGGSLNLGDLSVATLEAHKIPFVGDRAGIASIANSPLGDDAIEVLSDTRLRAYGWCVEIDGRQPDLMPDQVVLDASAKTVTWFYAYSLYDSGVWKDYCTPSWVLKTLPVCRE